MKIRLSQLSRAINNLVQDLLKAKVLYDEKITNIKVNDLVVTDKQWWCNNIGCFNMLGSYLEEVLKHDREDKAKDSKTKS